MNNNLNKEVQFARKTVPSPALLFAFSKHSLLCTDKSVVVLIGQECIDLIGCILFLFQMIPCPKKSQLSFLEMNQTRLAFLKRFGPRGHQSRLLSSFELRSRFLNYFEKHGHVPVKSASLIPHNDKSLLFTNAGKINKRTACPR